MEYKIIGFGVNYFAICMKYSPKLYDILLEQTGGYI